MNPRIKSKLADIGVGLFAILSGSIVIYFGDKLLGVTLEFYFGVATFSPLWVMDLFFVPFIGGIVVSMVYGLGGKILAHFSPLLVRIWSYYEYSYISTPPEGVVVLPISFWLLVLIVAAEFAAVGGFVGEILVKKTYGRTDGKHLLRKEYSKPADKPIVSNDSSKR